jgi:hypothetical protein
MLPRPAAFCLATSLFFGGLATARAQSLPSWDDRAEQAWWAKYPTPDTWPAAATDLKAQLEAAYKANGARVFSDPDFQAGLDQLLWVNLGLACPDTIADAAQLKTFVALGKDPAISRLFVEKLDPADLKPLALENILKLSEAGAADLHEYAALGVAFSLVFDGPFPLDWPHRQVATAAVPIGDVDVVPRFQFYVQSNRDHKLELDPSRLSFENLKYLVDSEVKLSELDWAQKNRVSYSQFPDAYFSIQYVTSRVSSLRAVYNWPHDSYALSEIRQEGGICIDQAYYAEILGKGMGIPTMRFSGYGMDGAHAWVGYLTSNGKWELDVGRYEQQDFPKGFAVDPQTWKMIDDATLENLFKNGAQNPSYQPAMTALSWAHLHEGDAAYPKILDDARGIMPEWSGTWRLQAALIDQGDDLEAKKKFDNDWITQFANFPEMKVEGQKRLYRALKAAADPDADGLLKDIVIQNRSEGFDLAIDVGSETLRDKLRVEDWDAARQVFERTVKDFGDTGGLTLYMKIVAPYVQACLRGNKLDAADHAVKFVGDYMSLDAQSQVGRQFETLKNEVASRKEQSR